MNYIKLQCDILKKVTKNPRKFFINNYGDFVTVSDGNRYIVYVPSCYWYLDIPQLNTLSFSVRMLDTFRTNAPQLRDIVSYTGITENGMYKLLGYDFNIFIDEKLVKTIGCDLEDYELRAKSEKEPLYLLDKETGIIKFIIMPVKVKNN